ncbi:ETX/MTX2 family pore-forming toxin [Bacillus mycoides]|uniref:ETX/MTX2 family pore-forming toxin n=1 Tax=Bacillus mycoides TaxID=1405 RepID=UPI001C032AB7|nr:ETX/MTX2 family pore-forming toxin [Bacillus mycoides]MED1384018.1 ETX/MTX2 family pore-forming toxin [Bacillus mycoides]
MNNKKNMKRKIAATSSIITLATSFAFTSPELVKADSKNSVSKNQQYMAAEERPTVPVSTDEDYGIRSLAIDNKDTFYDVVRKIVGWNGIQDLSANFLHYAKPTYSVDLVAEPKDEPLSPVLIGKTNIQNKSQSTQKLQSASMSKTVTSTVTSTVTHGAKAGAKASAKLKVPLVAEAGVELNTEYNFASAGSNTSTETLTYTLPSQSIELEPGQRATVTSDLSMMKTSGEVQLRTKYEGYVHLKGTLINTPNNIDNNIKMGDFVDRFIKADSSLREYWHVNSPNDFIAYQVGKGNFTAEYGTVANITVEIFNQDGTDTTQPIKSYTYTVIPEVSKNI